MKVNIRGSNAVELIAENLQDGEILNNIKTNGIAIDFTDTIPNNNIEYPNAYRMLIYGKNWK